MLSGFMVHAKDYASTKKRDNCRSVTVPVLDGGVQWDKPLKVKVDAFYHYDSGNAGEMVCLLQN